jgi:hypothetical protein
MFFSPESAVCLSLQSVRFFNVNQVQTVDLSILEADVEGDDLSLISQSHLTLLRMLLGTMTPYNFNDDDGANWRLTRTP